MNPRAKGATWDRAVTEAALQDAALDLLNRKGILGGLNLREVADNAGVNRGLVYHYFGGGRDLLRSALRKDMAERMREQTSARSVTFALRARLGLEVMIRQAESLRLVMILLLDNDEKVKILPQKDHSLADLRDRQNSGEIKADVDIEALHILQVCYGYGYALMRETMARELGMNLQELDDRVGKMAEWLGAATEVGPQESA